MTGYFNKIVPMPFYTFSGANPIKERQNLLYWTAS